MFGHFLRRRAKPEGAEETILARIATDTRLYCVGDIHGRADLLDVVAQFIAEDMKSGPQRVMTIFLGDYIDRGPDSAGVLERLSAGDFPTPIVALAGNHDRMMLSFLEQDSMLEDWRRYGALETLSSYGVPPSGVIRGGRYAETQAALRAALPPRHIAFLASCPLATQSGDYYFCHAGVRPEVPLAEQRPEDLLWIREPFLSFEGAFDKIIVHGHTRVARPDVRTNRINLDTGAFSTGILSCLILEDDGLRIFCTG